MLESLVSASIFLLILSLIQLTFSQYHHFYTAIYDDRQIEWHTFLITLEKELRASEELTCTDNQIFFTTMEGKEYIYEQKGSLIRKRSSKGGHQPVLMQVETSQFSKKGENIAIEVQFIQDKKYQGTVVIPNLQATNHESKTR